jgi:hypothetical protein
MPLGGTTAVKDRAKSVRDDLSFLVVGACLHPDDSVREKLSEELEDWIAELRPKHTSEDVLDVLDSQSGTALEPFVLSDSDRRILSLFVRAAFSEEIGCTRILASSADEIGGGSLLITQRLNCKYRETYVHGSTLNIHTKPWFFDARNAPKDRFEGLRKKFNRPATICCDDLGVEIGLPWPATGSSDRLVRFEDKRILSRPDESSFRMHSRFGSDQSLLTGNGLNVNLDEERLVVRTATPESTIRLLARISRGESLILDEEGSSFLAEVALDHPADGCATPLPTEFLAKQNPLPWIRTNCPVEHTNPSEETQEILGDYLLPYESLNNRISKRQEP